MTATTEPTMVPGYRHLPGNHCGSTALRNLLGFAGAEISEEMAFGLGAGACFYYLTLEDASPTRWFNGRVARLEENFRELTGGTLRMRTFEPGEEAWDAARAEVDAGRPALLLTDLYYLDHYGRSAHFPGHAVVLAGYDAEHAFLSDTGFEELQATRLENLARARHSSHPAYPLAGHMFTVAPDRVREWPPSSESTSPGGGRGWPSPSESTVFPRRTATPSSLLQAVPGAVERAAREMLEPQWGKFAGLPAVRRFAEEAPDWPEAAEDWQWCARFAYQVIERRGTGGGNFRPMYARFLAEAGYGEAPLAAAAGERWTELAAAFFAASESEEAEPPLWAAIGDAAAACAEAEERLWAALAAATR